MSNKSLFSLSVDKLTAQLRARGFMVKEQEDGAYLLVHPSRGKYDWEADELAFRSVVLDARTKSAAPRVVSVGWPKFFNQGEWPDHDAVVARDLEAGKAVITHKHDGSLLIRSVLPDGRILFRTRDTFDGGKFAPLAEAVARARYPALLDPAVFPEGTLLFEYVGADNQIVVRYAGDDDLILLGAVLHDGGAAVGDNPIRYLPYAEVEPLAQAHGLQLVETYPWADEARGVAEILALVQHWDKAEGVVVRAGDGQTLLKVKSAWYFAQHALRWHMTYESIVRFALDGGIGDESGLVAALTQAGWDYETTVAAREHFTRYQDRRAEAERIKETARAFVAAFASDYQRALQPALDGDGNAVTSGEAFERARRKALALRVFGPGADEAVRALASYIFLVYDDKQAGLDATLLRRVVLAPVAAAE